MDNPVIIATAAVAAFAGGVLTAYCLYLLAIALWLKIKRLWRG